MRQMLLAFLCLGVAQGAIWGGDDVAGIAAIQSDNSLTPEQKVRDDHALDTRQHESKGTQKKREVHTHISFHASYVADTRLFPTLSSPPLILPSPPHAPRHP